MSSLGSCLLAPFTPECCIVKPLHVIVKEAAGRAVPHRDLYAPKRIFSRNTAPKNHGRRQPCRGFLSCLAEKSLFWECFAVLKERFLFTGAPGGCRNALCISKPRGILWRKRFLQNRVNLYAVPPKGGFLLYLQGWYYCDHCYSYFLCFVLWNLIVFVKL